MNTLSRSWTLAKTTFAVMRADPELLVFPALSAVFTTAFILLMLVPTVVVDLLASGEGTVAISFGILDTLLLFLVYFVTSFLSTFFNVCVVYSAKTRFEGGNPTFMSTLAFAFSRSHQIAAWSLVSASVGLLLRWLDSLADQKGVVGLIFGVVRGLIGMAWAIVQLFVIPVMVYEGVGPFQAIKRSAQTLRDTWGESLVRHVGLGFLQFLAMLPTIGLGVLGIWVATMVLPAGIALIVLAVLLFVFVNTVFSVANTVYNTALYHYASTGDSPRGFEDVALETALMPR